MTIKEHVPLAPLTTFRLGGAARFFVSVQTLDELKEALAFAQEKTLAIFVLGGGSNVLVDDAGFEGLVIKIEIKEVRQEGDILIAGAGESWDALVARAVGAGLWGIENLSGIPGTVGGAVVQNIGAYGAALSQTLVRAEVYDRAHGQLRTLTTEALSYGYRESIFKKEPERYVVVRAAFALTNNGTPNSTYKDLADCGEVSIAQMRERVLSIRKGKFPDLSVEGTAGSYFKNPVVPEAVGRALQEHYPGLPLFTLPESAGVKVPLGWILDHVLHLRGYRLGEVRLFEKQALVIAASRDARASDVRALAQKVKKEVKEKTGIEIEEEVKVIHS